MSFLKTSVRLGETRHDLFAITDEDGKSDKSCAWGGVLGKWLKFGKLNASPVVTLR